MNNKNTKIKSQRRMMLNSVNNTKYCSVIFICRINKQNKDTDNKHSLRINTTKVQILNKGITLLYFVRENGTC